MTCAQCVLRFIGLSLCPGFWLDPGDRFLFSNRLSCMAPKLLSLARDLFLQELDDLPRGQDLKRKARDEGGNEATVKRRYSNLKLAEWFASPESEQQIFVDRAKARVDSSQPTLKEFLGSQSESSSGPGAHLELDQSQDSGRCKSSLPR